jgi:flagella basal body P-ring formation protein FlgA
MRRDFDRAIRLLAALTGALLLRATTYAAPPQTAESVVRAAMLERIGAGAEVRIRSLTPLPAEGAYRDARPDPSAVLGRPLRFTLIPESGSPVVVVADLDVVVDHARARRAIARSQAVTADDLEPVRAVVQGLPLRPLMTAAALAGARALRPIEAGAIVQTAFVSAKRAIEPGDRVTAVATVGAIEVSAVLVAADGGPIGATIRVVNPETRRVIKGRIVAEGRVEVLYGR